VYRLEITFPESAAITTYFSFPAGLLAQLQTSDPHAAPEEAGAAKTPAASGDVAVVSPALSRTFDVLLDVSMPVSVSFGRTEMMIKEVLKLTTGSIVELDRNVTEPVDLIVNDRVIARGEVVVVDGNYGVRIHEIVSLQERFRSSTQAMGSFAGQESGAGQLS
jgi:flagellar motor switch protein FliN/FliY